MITRLRSIKRIADVYFFHFYVRVHALPASEEMAGIAAGIAVIPAISGLNRFIAAETAANQIKTIKPTYKQGNNGNTCRYHSFPWYI
jgi:hypothetical protein